MKTNRIVQSVFTAAIFALAGFAGGVRADTVGWWRFEGTVGDKVSSCVNSANPGTSDLSLSGSAATVTNTPVRFADGTANATSVRMASTGNMAGGRFSAADVGTLRPQNFTLEGFFKWNTAVSLGTEASAGVFGKGYDSPVGFSYGVRLYGDALRADFRDSAGTKSVTVSSAGVKDGKWHHVAITFDDTTKVASLYLDYKLKGTVTLVSSVAYNTTAFYVGGYGSPLLLRMA